MTLKNNLMWALIVIWLVGVSVYVYIFQTTEVFVIYLFAMSVWGALVMLQRRLRKRENDSRGPQP
jgi:hypothetical protein